MKKVLVLGSLNKDLVSFVQTLPQVGQTLKGNSFEKFNGGKGANQAIAIANMEIATTMLGAIGNDQFGQQLLNGLKKDINIDHVIEKKTNSGLAIITVDKNSNNSIIVHGGANDLFSSQDILENKNLFKNHDIFVTQLENKSTTVIQGLKIAQKNNLLTVLTPAPSTKYKDEMIKYTNILIPNEHEFLDIFGIKHSRTNLIKISQNYSNVIFLITLGSKGVAYAKNGLVKFFKAQKVKALDTTAAGDCFVGGFISMLARNNSIEKAIDFGQKVAAISVTRKGAQVSMPTLKEMS